MGIADVLVVLVVVALGLIAVATGGAFIIGVAWEGWEALRRAPERDLETGKLTESRLSLQAYGATLILMAVGFVGMYVLLAFV